MVGCQRQNTSADPDSFAFAESPATASVDAGKTALVDASLRELLAFRDGSTTVTTSANGKSIGAVQCERSAF